VSPHVVVLGSGTSNGVPSPGREYPPEFLANPKNHRTRTSIVLCGPSGNVLVDCGPDFRSQVLRENILDIEACILTHTHADHVMGMDDLRAFCKRSGAAMPVYTSPQCQADVRRIFGYAFADAPPGVWVPRFDLRDAAPRMRLGGLDIVTFWVEHGDIPVLALRCNAFAYVTDVSRIPDGAMAELRGLDDLILDAVRIRPHPNHFHLERAVEVAREVGAKRTWFTHLSDDFDHDVTNAGLPEGMALCFDGLKIAL
jgi:phosphoribosyl 1,2-cyclic phosphate phosphodiesterase